MIRWMETQSGKSFMLGRACLRSWKEIASYAGVSIPTVQRWEREERLPVHRHLHRKRGSVYAFPVEIDTWLRERDTALGGAEPVAVE
jgi:transcriptional regulator with XRE-family HTH domain